MYCPRKAAGLSLFRLSDRKRSHAARSLDDGGLLAARDFPHALVDISRQLAEMNDAIRVFVCLSARRFDQRLGERRATTGLSAFAGSARDHDAVVFGEQLAEKLIGRRLQPAVGRIGL